MANLINLILLDASILENLLNGLHGLTEKIHVELLELGAGQRLGEVIAVLERLDLDAGRLLGRERALGLLDLTLELADGAKVLRDVGASLLLVGLDKMVHDTLVEIFSTKVSVTSSRENLKDTVVDGEEGNIESTTAQVVDDDTLLPTLLVETVRDSGGRRLVDDTENVKAGNGTGILGRLTLSVVEV
jgi:hypothetical protein